MATMEQVEDLLRGDLEDDRRSYVRGYHAGLSARGYAILRNDALHEENAWRGYQLLRPVFDESDTHRGFLDGYRGNPLAEMERRER